MARTRKKRNKMTRAYLLLLNVVDNDDIYIDHKLNRFVITYNNEKIVINREDVKDFITIFMNDKEALLEKLNDK
tara:strand:+ start:465 stop:686 length:222 start_codon:yes stop_codon:yes gene_type:complete